MVKQLAKALQTEKITEIADERFDFDPIDLKILKPWKKQCGDSTKSQLFGRNH